MSDPTEPNEVIGLANLEEVREEMKVEPAEDAPGPKAQAPTPTPKAGGGKKVKDTISNEEVAAKKYDSNDPRMQMVEDWQREINKANDAITRKVFGATAEDFWDDPKKAAKNMETQIGNNLKSIGEGFSKIKDFVMSALPNSSPSPGSTMESVASQDTKGVLPTQQDVSSTSSDTVDSELSDGSAQTKNPRH